jgi:hypothetical protein
MARHTIVIRWNFAADAGLPEQGTLVIMKAWALFSRQRAALTGYALLPLPGIVA